VIAGAYEGHGAIPKGAILMWSGDPGKLPSGWVLCNGQDGTPDLSSRFIVGYDPKDTLYNYAKTRNTGGEAKHTLTQAEMGTHTHTVKSAGKAVGSHRHQYIGFDTTEASANVDVYGSSTEGATKTTDPVAHENRPPYMVLAFIMYVGPSQ
jgi:microcystin-dependent protein